MIRLDNSLNSIIANSGYLRLDGTNVPTADYSWTTNFLTTGTLGAGAITGTSVTTGLTTDLGVYTTTGGLLTTTPPSSGTLGYWSRAGTVISTATAGDSVVATGNSNEFGQTVIDTTGLYDSTSFTIQKTSDNRSTGFLFKHAGDTPSYTNYFSAWASRGTLASPTISRGGDPLFRITVSGYEPSSFRTTASIDFMAGSTWGAADYSQSIDFLTAKTGETSRTSRFKIDEDGDIKIPINDQKLCMGAAGATDYYQQFNGTNALFYTSGDFLFNNGYIGVGPGNLTPLDPLHISVTNSANALRLTRDAVGSGHGDFAIQLSSYRFTLYDDYNNKSLTQIYWADAGFGAMANFIVGKDDDGQTTPVDGIFRAGGADVRVDDTAGANLYLASGRGQGLADPAKIYFCTPTNQATGSTTQPLVERWTIDSDFGLKSGTDGTEVYAIATAGSMTYKGLYKNIVTKTGAYTLTANDDTVLGDTNAFTLTLPAAASHTGKVYNIKKINTEYDEALTIDGNASETIDGLTNYVLRTVDSGIIIQSDGTNWVIIGAI